MLDVKITKNFRDFKLHTEFLAGNEILGILGPSGSGKSITLRSIAGIETPNWGKIIVNNRVLFDSAQKINLPARQRNIGYVFQNYALFPHLTVRENISFGLAKDISIAEKTDLIDSMLQSIKLTDRQKHYPAQLSGGQQQRVALARTLMTRPELLLLDEPFTALDNHLKRHLENELLAILQEYFQGTVLLVTHNADEAYRLCDRIMIYAAGRNVQLGEKQTVIEQPGTLEAAQVTGCQNLLPGEVSENNGIMLAQAGGLLLQCNLPKTAAQKVTIGFHGRNLRLYTEKPSIINTFPCQTVSVHAGIYFNTITVHCCGHLLQIDIQKQLWTEISQNNRDMLYLHIPPEKIFIF